MVGKVNNNGISQTPQAFLDCQVMDNEEGLFINWDIRNGILKKELFKIYFVPFNIFEKFRNPLNFGINKQMQNYLKSKWIKERM